MTVPAPRRLVATAGHVDHGKSTLVRALTGVEPDRWREERERGLTLDLGFAGTTLPSGTEVDLVDVPGHERYLANTLAGLGAAPMVMLVVAADEGWREQTSDHRDAIAALGIAGGLLVLSRADRAPDRVPAVLARARRELAGTRLADAPAVAVSALTGEGLPELRSRLDAVLAAVAPPDPEAPLRLWLDRSFTIPGAGTVVTGSLTAGTLRRGDRLHLHGATGDGAVAVRGLQTRGGEVGRLGAATRAAVNLRGAEAAGIARGDALIAPGAWTLTRQVDVRLVGAGPLPVAGDLPEQGTVHVGTAAVPVRARPLGGGHLRLDLERTLPLRIGDRLVLRGRDSRRVRSGLLVLDVDPPALGRRGAARLRAGVLAALPEHGDLTAEVARRGALLGSTARRHGLRVPPALPAELLRTGDWLLHADARDAWARDLRALVDRHRDQEPLSAGLPRAAAVRALDLPDPALLPPVVEAAGLRERDGRVLGAEDPGMGQWEEALGRLEARLREEPFRAPEAAELQELGLDARALAAAAHQGRLLRLRGEAGEVVLLPTAPALAMRALAGLAPPVTASAARQAWGTSRRVAIPLLEHLDARGWTRRREDGTREIVR